MKDYIFLSDPQEEYGPVQIDNIVSLKSPEIT